MTLAAIWGQKFIPGVLDYYLGKTGYDSQQQPQPRDQGRQDDLFEPIRGDRGAHGEFDSRSHDHSNALWAEEHRRLLGTLAGGAAALLGLTLLRRS